MVEIKESVNKIHLHFDPTPRQQKRIYISPCSNSKDWTEHFS